MGVIFWLSSRTADESSAQSSAVLKWLTDIFGDGILTDFIVRKLAHCLEFTGLCILINFDFLFEKKKIKPFWSVIFTSAYALTDELHQIFVDGRSCQISDWAVDTTGAIIGAAGFWLICFVISTAAHKRKKYIDTKNN